MGLFGWEGTAQTDPDGNYIYTMFTKGGKNVAGLGGQPPGMPSDMPAVWNSYIATDDVGATAEKVTAAGGNVMMPPMQVLDSGEMAIFSDPTGAAFSVWKAGEHIGAEIGNEPDTYSWNELMTRDIDAALPFYSAVFGWTYDQQDMGPAGIYHVIAGGESGGLGGLTDLFLGIRAAHDDEVPGLQVGAARRGARGLQRGLDDVPRHRPVGEVSHGAAPRHVREEPLDALAHLVDRVFAIVFERNRPVFSHRRRSAAPSIRRPRFPRLPCPASRPRLRAPTPAAR